MAKNSFWSCREILKGMSITSIAEMLNVKKNQIKIAQNMVVLGEGLKYIS